MIDVKHLKSLYKREKFLVVSNIAVMTVTFLILGFFLSLSIGFQTAIKNLEEQAQVTLFFKDEYQEAQILALRDELMKDERILSVTYVSKEEAFRIFTDINKDEPILLEAVSKDIYRRVWKLELKNWSLCPKLPISSKTTKALRKLNFSAMLLTALDIGPE